MKRLVECTYSAAEDEVAIVDDVAQFGRLCWLLCVVAVGSDKSGLIRRCQS